MRIDIMSRKEFEEYNTEIPFIVISITDPGSEYAETESKPLARLNLEFFDLDRPINENKNCFLFDDNMARQILDFVECFKDKVKRIIIHCEAGISRSAGVAGALANIYEGTDQFYFDNYVPNRLVYRKILNAYYDSEE